MLNNHSIFLLGYEEDTKNMKRPATNNMLKKS